MKTIKIISEWKKRPSQAAQQKFGYVGPGYKMVEAVVSIDGNIFTRHIQVPR